MGCRRSRLLRLDRCSLALALQTDEHSPTGDSLQPAGIMDYLTLFGVPVKQVYGPFLFFAHVCLGRRIVMFDYDWRRDALEQSVQLERQVERLHAQVHRL